MSPVRIRLAVLAAVVVTAAVTAGTSMLPNYAYAAAPRQALPVSAPAAAATAPVSIPAIP